MRTNNVYNFHQCNQFLEPSCKDNIWKNALDNKFVYSHDIADDAGLFAMSFGIEEVDRYITVYKKEFVPTEDEITARKNQEEWNEETAKKYQELVSYTLFF